MVCCLASQRLQLNMRIMFVFFPASLSPSHSFLLLCLSSFTSHQNCATCSVYATEVLNWNWNRCQEQHQQQQEQQRQSYKFWNNFHIFFPSASEEAAAEVEDRGRGGRERVERERGKVEGWKAWWDLADVIVSGLVWMSHAAMSAIWFQWANA